MMRDFISYIGLFLVYIFVGSKSYSNIQGQIFENNYLVIGGGYPKMANSANTDDGESENLSKNIEKCDNELVRIVANHGSSFFIMCLETDENERIKGFHYNSYHEDTEQFQSRKTFDEDQLEFNNCSASDETHFFASQNSNNFERSSRAADYSRIRNKFDKDECVSTKTIDIVSMMGINFLNLELSQFTVDRGGHLQFSYKSNPFDPSYESLDLRLFRRNNEWMLGDANDDRIVTFDVELKKIWLFKPVVVGIKKINPMYEEDQNLP